MKIAQLRLHPVALALRAPLATAHGTVDRREGFVVELTTGAGTVGWGEALPLASFGGETLADCDDALRAAAPPLVGRELTSASASGVEEVLDPALAAAAPVARCALETALLDAAAREAGDSLASLLGGSDARGSIEVNALLTAAAPDAAR